MLVISSLHVHEQDETVEKEVCNECVHHHCYGHISQLSTSIDHCVLCQFLTLTFIAATTVLLVRYNKLLNVRVDARQRNVCVAHGGIVGLRAPPVFSI